MTSVRDDKDLDVGYVEQLNGMKIVVYHKRAQNTKARVATEFITRWGMVAAEPDGEDSAGRQQLKVMSTEHLVERAIKTADLLIDEFERRGWFLELPAPRSEWEE